MVLDVNECLETLSVCGPNSVCNNTIGDYNCTCWSGYNVTDPSLKSSANNTCTGNVVFFKALKALAHRNTFFCLSKHFFFTVTFFRNKRMRSEEPTRVRE